MIDYHNLRTQMVEHQLRPSGVLNSDILNAIGAIPRELFVPDAFKPIAYSDKSIAIAENRELIDATSLGLLLQLAENLRVSRALVIGAGNGYSTAVLSKLADSVVSIESNAELYNQSIANIGQLGLSNCKQFQGDIALGMKEHAPYDLIFIDGSVQQVPKVVLSQLADHGELIAVVGQRNSSYANLFKSADKIFTSRPSFGLSLPVLSEFNLPAKFSLD